jgi:wyosine [tRNA(Phe)-imidazoG37] synthetase (radical SAM superfamily)
MSPIPLQSEIIYGPVRTRRLGWSLGLNVCPIPYKLCSFNCVYCQYGWTEVRTTDMTGREGDLPTPDQFRRELEAALKCSAEIDNITFSGNGEATLHPNFDELVGIARELRDRHFPEANLGILSNSSMVNVQKVRQALARLDFRIMKLDAGSADVFRRINLPDKSVLYSTIVEGLKTLERVTLQTLFVTGRIQNSGEVEVADWIARVGEISPIKAQIYSLHRPSADEFLEEVPEERLRQIAEQTEKATGAAVEVVVASQPYRRRYNEPFRK